MNRLCDCALAEKQHCLMTWVEAQQEEKRKEGEHTALSASTGQDRHRQLMPPVTHFADTLTQWTPTEPLDLFDCYANSVCRPDFGAAVTQC